MNNVYKLLSAYNGVDGLFEDKPRYFKGETELIYDFSVVGVGNYSVIKIIADFNDKSPLYIREFDYLDKDSITNIPITHKYYPNSEFDNIFYFPTFYIYYSNFKRFVYQTPIRITKESFYSRYKRLTINSAQFIDDSNNSLFVSFQTREGDILNTKIK